MIATFPVLNLKFDSLPTPIKKHLRRYKDRLEPKPKSWKGGKWSGRKAGSYEWFETQDSISYHTEFSKPKIIYPEITKWMGFYYDATQGFTPNNKGFIVNTDTESLPYLVGFCNSSLFRCCFKDNFPEVMGHTYEMRKIFVELLPIKKPSAKEASLFEKIVPLIQLAKKHEEAAQGSFLEDLIDACVMECYFRKHMAERDLLFHDTVAPLLADFNPKASEAKQRDFVTQLHTTLNSPSHPIRNRLLRLTADSPDLLAVIKREGKV